MPTLTESLTTLQSALGATAQPLADALAAIATPPVVTPPVPPERTVLVVPSKTAPGRVDLAAKGFGTDRRRRDGGKKTQDGGWEGPIVGGDAPGLDLTVLTPGDVYLFGLHDSTVGDWVEITYTMPTTVVPPPVFPPPLPGTQPRLSRRLLQGWFRWNDAAAIPAFESAEGAPLDIFHLSVDGNDPNPVALTTLGHCADWVLGAPGRLLVMNWNWMGEAPGDFFNGNIDAKAVQVAQFLQQLGIAHLTFIRPGYEPNAWWMPWGDQFPGNFTGDSYKAMWRRVIPKMRAEAPALRVEWCVVPGTAAAYDPANPTGPSVDPELWYPGDDVVDIVTLDQYPWWGVTDFASFLNTPKGLAWIAAFGKLHNKPWGISEVASVDPAAGTQGTGDDGQFFTELLDWCDQNGCSWVLYEGVGDGGVGYNDMPPNTAQHWGQWFQTHR